MSSNDMNACQSLAAGAILLGAWSTAPAAITTQHASMCTSVGSNRLSFDEHGVTNVGYSNGELHCPVHRVQLPGAGGFKVWIDGYVPEHALMTCLMTSYNDGYPDWVLGYVEVDIVGPIAFDQSLTLPAAAVPTWSDQVIDCEMPGGSQLFDVEPAY